ncbi:MAG TPA: YjbQ family protein [Dehalococcoidia bacterium]|nr:YjbQ family protein [Dehalococcoidia bacterium]
MTSYAAELVVQTKGDGDMVDLTAQVNNHVGSSGIRSGLVTVFVVGSTAGVTTIEYEAGLVSDLNRTMEKLAPSGVAYEHDRRWGDGNGHSHVRASVLGPSLTVPLVNGRLVLGTWQQVVLVDFDTRPRTRRIVVQVLGE